MILATKKWEKGKLLEKQGYGESTRLSSHWERSSIYPPPREGLPAEASRARWLHADSEQEHSECLFSIRAPGPSNKRKQSIPYSPTARSWLHSTPLCDRGGTRPSDYDSRVYSSDQEQSSDADEGGIPSGSSSRPDQWAMAHSSSTDPGQSAGSLGSCALGAESGWASVDQRTGRGEGGPTLYGEHEL